MKKRVAAAVAAVVVTLCTALTAVADNQFNVGFACHAGPSAPLWTYSHTQALVNLDHTSHGYFYCPIDRGGFGPLGTMAVKVFVGDGTDTDEVCCWAGHTNASTGVSFLSSYECTGDANTGVFGLDLAVPGHSGSFDGAFAICRLPAAKFEGGGQSEIRGLRGIEQ
ncbi:hypothetical protein WME95_48430 [Sorangium sp. So ce327]|uniref:hypothetical protein n=1 Tax=unclassified Sorangium TaxID=2621164 RepID=UPI003F5D5B08